MHLRIESQVRHIKTECENVLRRQELDFNQDKQKMHNKIRELETKIKDMRAASRKGGKQIKEFHAESELNRLIE